VSIGFVTFVTSWFPFRRAGRKNSGALDTCAAARCNNACAARRAEIEVVGEGQALSSRRARNTTLYIKAGASLPIAFFSLVGQTSRSAIQLSCQPDSIDGLLGNYNPRVLWQARRLPHCGSRPEPAAAVAYLEKKHSIPRERLMSRLPARRLHTIRSAFTLVEMLIAMVLTLIMVAAIAEFYAYVGDSVKDGRAMIEMGGQMRAAVQRLKSDFDQITISVVPWADDGAAQGYFEYREGRLFLNPNNNSIESYIATDYDSNANNVIDATIDEDMDNDNVNDLLQSGATDLLGDCDDYLAFTIRSNGEPFSGRWYDPNDTRHEIVYSQLAEVVWFVAFKDLNNDDNWDWNEPRYLVRRLLLIRPDLPTLIMPNTAGANDNVFHHNDISAHGVVVGTNPPTWTPNSFENLSKRENRFGHQWNQPNAFQFPNKLLINSFDHTTIETYALNGDFEGEDVVLSNLLAFDVRVYDPQAVLRMDVSPSLISGGATAANALAPPDVGYLQAVVDDHTAVGTGAYVDLGYGMKFYEQLQRDPYNRPAVQASQLLFGVNNPFGFLNPSTPGRLGGSSQYYAQPPVAGPGVSGGALITYLDRIWYTYDTWSLAYERDGINQDQDNVSGMSGTPLIDEGTNGVDDADSTGAYANGVDDFNERETRPPYSQPLRGLQVKIRMYEASTRQMRQATVTTDFLAE